MEYEEVLKQLAPCGLDCGRCADYENGEIKHLSSSLIRLLGSYERVAKMKAEARPLFNNYAQFEDILTAFSRASCSGCRGENVQCFIICAAKTCHKEKGVDFCFQCDEYPCEKQFSSRLRERWRERNDRMKDLGVVQFYCEQKENSRY